MKLIFFFKELQTNSDGLPLTEVECTSEVFNLMILSEDDIQRAGDHLPEDFALPIICESKLQHSVQFAISRHHKISVRLTVFTQRYFRDAVQLTLKLLQSLQAKWQNQIPLHFSADRLKTYFLNTFQKLKVRNEMIERLIRLKAYVKKFLHSPKFPQIPIEHLRQAMLESSATVVEIIEFVSHGFFDDFLSFFIQSHRTFKGQLFDRATDRLSQLDDTLSIDFSHGIN